MSDPILTEVTQGVFTITINRPEKKNPLTQAMYLQIKTAIEAAGDDPAVRVVLLRGAGGVFTAGNDMQDFSSRSNSPQGVMDSPAAQMMLAWLALEKPIVAAVAGFAIGIGATCLLHCDAVIAGRSTWFQLPFTTLGLVPEFGSTLTLMSAAGRVKASHYLLTGAAFSAQTALEMGMVSQLCDDVAVDANALQLCQQLASLPPASVRATKKLIKDCADQEKLLTVINDELVEFRQARESGEHREAVAAFVEKRPADFSKFV